MASVMFVRERIGDLVRRVAALDARAKPTHNGAVNASITLEARESAAPHTSRERWVRATTRGPRSPSRTLRGVDLYFRGLLRDWRRHAKHPVSQFR